MKPTAQALYLDLLKKTLSFSLWPEPPKTFSQVQDQYGPVKKRIFFGADKLLSRQNLMLAQNQNVTAEQREEGLIWPAYADSMIGHKRLDNLQFCIETVLEERIPGDFIETGVWRGGSCIFMRGALAAYQVTDRRVFVADSFCGLPEPDAEKYPADAGDTHHQIEFLSVSQQQVENNFKRYELLDEQVVFLPGFFADSLPEAPIETLAILRLDGDMYGSTMDALNALYHKLSPGGFCVVDDYGLPGCKQAIDDFRAEHNITEPLITVDWTGRYWRKK